MHEKEVRFLLLLLQTTRVIPEEEEEQKRSTKKRERVRSRHGPLSSSERYCFENKMLLPGLFNESGYFFFMEIMFLLLQVEKNKHFCSWRRSEAKAVVNDVYRKGHFFGNKVLLKQKSSHNREILS